MNNKRYFQIQTKKGWFVAEESDDENIFINLGNGERYYKKEDDILKEVDAEFVAKILENINNKEKEFFAKIRQYKLSIIALSVSILFAYGLHKQTTRISYFEILFQVSLLLFMIQNLYSSNKSQEKIRKIRENNYYIALKRSSNDRRKI